jgi:cytochrome c553
MRISTLLAAVAAAGATLSPTTYAQVPVPPPAPAPAKAAACLACHGPNGNSPGGVLPSLAGQTSRYLYLQLRDYQERRRKDHPVTSPMIEELSRDELLELSNYYAKQKLAPNGFKADAARAARGSRKADEVLCTMCHLGGFLGQNEIPRVAGQQYDYIVKQLNDFKARRRTNDAGSMTSVTHTLSDEDILDLANFLADL